MARDTTITHVRVTPIAFRDGPLLNAAGIHEPWALRSIVEIETSDGRVGISETYGDEPMLKILEQATPLWTRSVRKVPGLIVVDTTVSVKDPQTGRSLGHHEMPLGTVRVDRVSTQTSYGTLLEGADAHAGVATTQVQSTMKAVVFIAAS